MLSRRISSLHLALAALMAPLATLLLALPMAEAQPEAERNIVVNYSIAGARPGMTRTQLPRLRPGPSTRSVSRAGRRLAYPSPLRAERRLGRARLLVDLIGSRVVRVGTESVTQRGPGGVHVGQAVSRFAARLGKLRCSRPRGARRCVTAESRGLHTALEVAGTRGSPVRRVWIEPSGGGAPPAARAIRTFPLPTTNAEPTSIARGPDGALWFTEEASLKIGRIDTDGRVAEFAASPPGLGGAFPYGITTGPEGALWYGLGGFQLGRMETNGSVRVFEMGTPVNDVASSPDGALWVTSIAAGTTHDGLLLRVATDGSVQRFPIAAGHYPTVIAAGPDGALWFAVTVADTEGTSGVGRLTTSGAYAFYPDQAWMFNGITTGPDGAMWLTRQGDNPEEAHDRSTHEAIVRIAPDGTMRRFPTLAGDMKATGGDPRLGAPMGLAAGPDGAIWYVDSADNRIGRITVEGVFSTRMWIPTPPGFNFNTEPTDIVAGPDGAMWFTMKDANRIGRISVH